MQNFFQLFDSDTVLGNVLYIAIRVILQIPDNDYIGHHVPSVVIFYNKSAVM